MFGAFFYDQMIIVVKDSNAYLGKFCAIVFNQNVFAGINGEKPVDFRGREIGNQDGNGFLRFGDDFFLVCKV